MAGKQKPTKKLKAWMVVSRYGHPVQESHPWGWNFIVAKKKYEASTWRDGEKVVPVQITMLPTDD